MLKNFKISEKNEYIINEMITHIPLMSNKTAETILIIGKNNEGIYTEINKHNNIKNITQIKKLEEISNISDISKYDVIIFTDIDNSSNLNNNLNNNLSNNLNKGGLLVFSIGCLNRPLNEIKSLLNKQKQFFKWVRIYQAFGKMYYGFVIASNDLDPMNSVI